MIKYILVILFTFSSINAQEKYLVFLKDKGVETPFYLGSESWNLAVNSLSQQSIDRRIKHLGQNNFVSFEDVPISEEYINKIILTGAKFHHAIKWFNCVSVYAGEATLQKIKDLDFVSYVRPVLRFKMDKPLFNESYESPVYAATLTAGVENLREQIFTPSEFIQSSVESDASFFGPSLKNYEISRLNLSYTFSRRGAGVTIGVLDSGFDWKNHQALKNSKVIAEYDFVQKDGNTADESGDRRGQHSHGTFCFSVAGGFYKGKLVGPSHNANFILCKTEDVKSETMMEEDNYAAAIIFMDSIGVDITTSSLGYTTFDDTTYTYDDLNGKTAISTRAVNYAYSKGILPLTAAGNSARDSWYYVSTPGDSPLAIAVGAVNTRRYIAPFSSGGPTSDGRIKPDVSAMGVQVYGAQAGSENKYESANGTSAATPVVAGLAGQLLSDFPYLKNNQLFHIIKYSADQSLYPDNVFGYGVVNAVAAYEYPHLEFRQDGSILLKKFFADRTEFSEGTRVVFTTEGQIVEKLEMNQIAPGRFELELDKSKLGSITKFHFESVKSNKIFDAGYGREYFLYPEDINIYAEAVDLQNLSKNFSQKDFQRYLNSTRFFARHKSGAVTGIKIKNLTGTIIFEKEKFDKIEFTDTIFLKDLFAAGYKPKTGAYIFEVYLDGKLSTKQIFVVR
ncbi:MAG: S8 family serine peptidase [Ignavibacteriaceae bacterium]|nr:S8 family serine peptidase [Ignavibacteriaceae bacterium]